MSHNPLINQPLTDPNGVIFRNPPAPNRPGTNWAQVAEQVKARPGQWAYLGHRSTGTIGRVISGRVPGFTGEWEFTTRSRPDSTHRDLYARYLGPENQADWNARIDYGTYYTESETQK